VGKTTHAKICLELGLRDRRHDRSTQPGVFAARTVAERIAAELDVEVERRSGYAIRFNDRSSPDTLIRS